MKITTLAFICALCMLAAGCAKERPTCGDRSALNYNSAAPANNYGGCMYPLDSVTGQYRIRLVSYPLQPSTEGDRYDWTLTGGNCYSSAPGKPLNIDALTGPITPDNLCIHLVGFQFVINDSSGIYYWAGAPLNGTCDFKGDSLTFTGTVTPSSGISYPIVLKGYKYAKL